MSAYDDGMVLREIGRKKFNTEIDERNYAWFRAKQLRKERWLTSPGNNEYDRIGRVAAFERYSRGEL